MVKQPHSGEENFELDKDWTVRGNRQYAPKFCCFVPKHISSLLCWDKVSERRMKEVAEIYKNVINETVYSSLISWRQERPNAENQRWAD
jgi:hypothetical protein